MMGWYGTNKAKFSLGNASKTGAGSNIMTASKNIADGMIKLGEYQDKQDEKAEFKLEKQKAQQKQIDMEDALIKGYEEKHPKFMGKHDKDGKDIDTYKDKTRLEKLALIQMAGNEVNNKKSGKVVNVYTGNDGHKMAVFSDGSEKKLSKAHIYNGGSGSKSSKPSSNAPYGYNADGSVKTAHQYGEEQAKKRALKREAKMKLENTEIN
jgi:hypothetical protein